jgi:dipeptide/tripeptide permease
VFTTNTAMIALGQGLVVNAMEGSVRTNIVAVGSLLAAVSYAVLLSANWTTAVPVSIAIVLLGAIIYTGGELVTGPVLNALSTTAAPFNLRGRYVSLFQLSWTASVTVAPVALTWLLDTGPTAVWGALAAVSLVGIALSSLLRHTMPLAAETMPHSRPTTTATVPTVS